MPAFSYEAINTEGLSRKGVLDAESARAARNMLRAQQLVPLSVELVGQGSGGVKRSATQSGSSLSLTSPITFGRRVFGASALMIWTRQLASLVSAGLPLERALTALTDEASTPAQRDLVASLRAEVNSGVALGKALENHPQEFSELYVAVITSGEQTGRLGQVLERLANDLERAQSLKSKLLAASLYPAIVSLVAFAIVLFLLSYVVPQVATVFASSHHALPTLTVVMLAVSKFVQNYWAICFGIVLIAAFALKSALKGLAFRQRFDANWLRLPLLGKLSLGYNSARFASTLALLSGAGVPILKSLETAAQTLSNEALKAHALEALVLVREGAPLANALAQNARMPPMLSMFARLGEQTGQLPEMLEKAAHHLGSEVERRALNIATILEPLLIVVMGVVVLLIVLAVMLPIIQLNQWVH
jgi:general secretion pathway protein F